MPIDVAMKRRMLDPPEDGRIVTRAFIARTIASRHAWSQPVPSTLALRHVAFEDLGLLAPLLASRGHAVRYVDVPVTDVDGFDALEPDLLVVLGGPIGVYEVDLYPFLAQETAFIARRLEAPIELTAEGRQSSLRRLERTAVLHWHGDTFDLPDGGVRLASTAVCKNQAFAWGERALALQFHAEAAGKALESWFVGHTAEIAATPGISVPRLRADTAQWAAAIAEHGTAFFAGWLSSVGL
jgi:GMP synthase (glutamine-hydrolysing)